MISYVYDGTFEGLLTLVFNVYEQKQIPEQILQQKHESEILFPASHKINTDEQKAERVWKGLQKKLSPKALQKIYRVFLSESEGVEMLIFNYIKLVFDTSYSIEYNYREECVLGLNQVNRKVSHEACKIVEFVRFQKTKDNLYFSAINPEYNVIPLIVKHFENRYADQQWVIYDTKRNYGIYYDLEKVSEVVFENISINLQSGKVIKEVQDDNEALYQLLWKNYFKSINIVERKNSKLQLRLMPQKYRKFLTEIS